MAHRERQIEEKRLAGSVLAPHEVDRLVHQFIVYFGAHRWGERLDLAQRPAKLGLDDVRSLREERSVGCIE